MDPFPTALRPKIYRAFDRTDVVYTCVNQEQLDNNYACTPVYHVASNGVQVGNDSKIAGFDRPILCNGDPQPCGKHTFLQRQQPMRGLLVSSDGRYERHLGFW
jgi:hypothetical protein